eukprot:gene2330-2683_t
MYSGKPYESSIETRIRIYENLKTKSSGAVPAGPKSLEEEMHRFNPTRFVWLCCLDAAVLRPDPRAHGWKYDKTVNFDGLAASRASAIIPYFSLVICPLNSLIADQSRRLRELGCRVLSLVDEKDGKTKIRQGKYHFLFTSPESILGKYRDELRHLDFQRRVACIAVDECHCVVKWGSESKKTKHFRHLYNDIAQLRSLWLLENPIPIVALTATANY